METQGERLTDLLRRGQPGDPALIEAESGRVETFSSLAHTAESLAAKLATLGVRRGSRVSLVVPNGPDFICLLLALAEIGATAAPLNSAYKRDEYAFYLEHLEPDLLVLPAGDLSAAREVA